MTPLEWVKELQHNPTQDPYIKALWMEQWRKEAEEAGDLEQAAAIGEILKEVK